MEINDAQLKKMFQQLSALDKVPKDVSRRLDATIAKLIAAEKASQKKTKKKAPAKKAPVAKPRTTGTAKGGGARGGGMRGGAGIGGMFGVKNR
jgi:hypothetical protein